MRGKGLKKKKNKFPSKNQTVPYHEVTSDVDPGKRKNKQISELNMELLRGHLRSPFMQRFTKLSLTNDIHIALLLQTFGIPRFSKSSSTI